MLLSFKIKLLLVTLHAAVLLLVVAHDVDQPEVGAGEEQLVEVLRVDLRAPPPPPHGLHQGGHHAAGPLHLVVQVPRREQDPGLRAVQVIIIITLALELQTNLRRSFTITEKDTTRVVNVKALLTKKMPLVGRGLLQDCETFV